MSSARDSRNDLPEQLQSKLDHAAILSAGDHAESSIGDGGIRIVEVDLIEHIEHLRAELDPHRLADHEVLEYAEIRTIEGGPADQTSPRIAVRSGGYKVRLHERGRVKERIHKSIAVGVIEGDVLGGNVRLKLGMLSSERAIQGHVLAHGKSERRSALDGMDSGESPAAGQSIFPVIIKFERQCP